MASRVQRLIVKGLLVLTAMAGFAFMANQHDHPCTGDSVGAGGMCVTTTWAGGSR